MIQLKQGIGLKEARPHVETYCNLLEHKASTLFSLIGSHATSWNQQFGRVIENLQELILSVQVWPRASVLCTEARDPTSTARTQGRGAFSPARGLLLAAHRRHGTDLEKHGERVHDTFWLYRVCKTLFDVIQRA